MEHGMDEDKHSSVKAGRTRGSFLQACLSLPGRQRSAWMICALSIAAFGVYAGTLGHDLVWDDPMLLNVAVSRVIEGGIPHLLTSEFTFHSAHSTGYYRPVVLFSLWIDLQLSDILPASYHLTNIAVHTLNTVALFFLLRLTLISRSAALLGALLFAVHPVHAEPVSFISGRTDLLATFFVLFSTLAWLKSRKSESPPQALPLCIGGLTFALACISKEVAFMLPAVLLCWDAVEHHGPWRKFPAWWKRNGRWAVAWILSLSLVFFLRFSVAGIEWGMDRGRLLEEGIGVSGFDIVMTARIMLAYLRLLVAPWPLSSFYTSSNLGMTPTTALAAALFCLLFAAAWRKHRREGLFALIWTVGFLVPVSGVVPIGGAVLAERFLYLPSAGLCMIAGLLLAGLAGSSSYRPQVLGVIAAAGLLLSAATVRRSAVWKNDAVLYRDMVRTSPESFVAQGNLGKVLLREGKIEEALSHFRASLELRPGSTVTYNNIANALVKLGRKEEAVEYYMRAILLDPDFADVHYNLAVTLLGMGAVQKSLHHYREALRLEPNMGDALNDLSWIMATHESAAIRSGEESLRLAHKACLVTGYENHYCLDTLAAAYAETGLFDKAAETEARAVALAESGEGAELLQEMKLRLRLYQSGQPFRQAYGPGSDDP